SSTPWKNTPSSRSPPFRSASNATTDNKVSSTLWQSLVVAATILGSAGAVATTNPLPAQASLDISPGTTVVETAPELTPKKFVESTAGTALKVTKTAYSERKDLIESVKRLGSAATNEYKTTEAWQNVWALLKKYGVETGSQVTIKPPADLQRAANDLLQEGKANFIVNGEIVQVSIQYKSGKDIAAEKAAAAAAAVSEKTETTDASSTSTSTSAPIPVPDDEWILKIEGYKGVDPSDLQKIVDAPRGYQPFAPQFLRDLFRYASTPYPEKYLMDVFKKNKENPVTYGDIFVLEGTLAIGFTYAWSYAYYLAENDKIEQEGIAKKKAVAARKKKAATATKNKKKGDETWDTPAPPADTSAAAISAAVIKEPKVAKPSKSNKGAKTKTIDEIKDAAEEDVKVSIDFDGSGQMVITATENKPRDSVFAFAQALCFPWLGMLIPSLTAPETIVIDSAEEEEEKEGVFPFLRALYLPWLGILLGK
ncbi:MAG: hypothetical protein SGARI_002316, partial [Bacillariaceae sp.]